MLTGILIISLAIFMAVVSYRRRKLEERVIKQIPIIDWLLMFVFPILFYIGLVLIIKGMLHRPRVNILDFEDIFLIGVGTIFMIYAIVGISLHFVSKVLSRYIRKDKNSKVYQINEIFHGKLSHYLTYACAYMVTFTLALLEINYPNSSKLSFSATVLMFGTGAIAGFSAFKAIFWTNTWMGGYNKPFFIITLVFLIILRSIYKSYDLNMGVYPMNMFICSLFTTVITIYVSRQVLIYSKLSKKKRMRFLSRLLSTS